MKLTKRELRGSLTGTNESVHTSFKNMCKTNQILSTQSALASHNAIQQYLLFSHNRSTTCTKLPLQSPKYFITKYLLLSAYPTFALSL